ncbi:MAG: hypothetical protein E7158_03625 [Firmicutes bacterium]|nr:hypothetical protein [Bacillota bacterium]
MAYKILFKFYYKGSEKNLDEIGSILKTTRESSGVSIEEASRDLDIKVEILENIEAGKIGCFKDIYVLKDYIKNYSKYLGLESEKIIDGFNEYMFEYTSKIPVKKIEQLMKQKEKEKEKEEKVISPYTMEVKKHKNNTYIMVYTIVIIIILLIVFWSVRQLTINTTVANEISYVKE